MSCVWRILEKKNKDMRSDTWHSPQMDLSSPKTSQSFKNSSYFWTTRPNTNDEIVFAMVALIPCPDSEARNIWPEFWPKREGYLARQLTPEQLQYFRRYFDTDMHKSITYDRWNKYVGIFNVRKSIFESAFYKKKSVWTHVQPVHLWGNICHQHPILDQRERGILLRRRMSNLTTKACKFLLLARLQL